jgi:arsenate reductase
VSRVDVVIYHNPKCSKSRRALELLREHGVKPRVVEYLAEPPTTAEIESILARLGARARDVVRTHEPVYATLGLEAVRDEADLVRAIAENPILLERAIVVAGERAVIGRPPERVLEIL